MFPNNPRRPFRTMLPPNRLHEIALGIHQIEIDRVIDQVILPGLDPLRRAEIDPVLLAHVLDLLPTARDADDARVELGEVVFQHQRGVAGRVAGDEEGQHGGGALGRGGSARAKGGRGNAEFGGRGVDEVDDPGELVEFFRADVRAVGETEVDLEGVEEEHV